MLILVPTRGEAERLLDGASPVDAQPVPSRIGEHAVRAALVGFGPIAAAVLGTIALREANGEAVFLVGLAGTYQPRVLPAGGLLVATEAISADVGRGRGDTFLGPDALGLPQTAATASRGAVWDRLPLHVPPPGVLPGAPRGPLLTVARTSASPREALACAEAHPDALAEEMEGFAVALAARQQGLSLTVLRGISNVAGDVDRAAWRIDEALGAVRRGLLDLLG